MHSTSSEAKQWLCWVQIFFYLKFIKVDCVIFFEDQQISTYKLISILKKIHSCDLFDFIISKSIYIL